MSAGLVSLFFGSLLASTLVPGGVEGLLYYMVQQADHSFMSLLVTASVGNTIGGVITFGVGALLHLGIAEAGWQQRLDRWFKLETKSVERVRTWGTPALLLSWLPVIGDPICLAAGYLRLRFWPSVLMIALGKIGRYIVLIWALQKALA
ncbi:MAG: YqaA family protein [bacterium]